MVKILRVLRVLRPLRAINRAKGLKVSDSMLYHSMQDYSGSVVECLTRDRGAVGWSLTDATVLCP